MIVFLILTCEKNNNRETFVRKTWLPLLPYKYFFVKSDPKIKKEIVEVGDTLFVKCDEIYENLPLKMVKVYNYLSNTADIEGVFKIDDDCLIRVKELMRKIEERKYVDYWGKQCGKTIQTDYHFGKCSDPGLNKTRYCTSQLGFYYSGGGYGYYLSKRSLKIIGEEYRFNKRLFNNEFYEDVLIGKILWKHGVKQHYATNLCASIDLALKDVNRIIYIGNGAFNNELYEKVWKKISAS